MLVTDMARDIVNGEINLHQLKQVETRSSSQLALVVSSLLNLSVRIEQRFGKTNPYIDMVSTKIVRDSVR